jgi:hypothetical protein
MKARRLYIHVGYPKCGSTSLQAALAHKEGLTYPSAGRHADEHISLPLYLKGVDSWTSQWFSEDWVSEQHEKLLQEISEAEGDVYLSSERLISLTPDQIENLSHIFKDWDIHILVLIRSIDKYLDSTWRHAVFWHDYPETKETFIEITRNFSFQKFIDIFSSKFDTHIFNIDDKNLASNIKDITGITLMIEHKNVGIPEGLADLLQKTHRLMGSSEFKSAFPFRIKEEMRLATMGERSPIIDPLDAVIF